MSNVTPHLDMTNFMVFVEDDNPDAWIRTDTTVNVGDFQ